ncbi:MAG: mandelate racemase/muconate lactonizing enzyme family protein [Halobacteriaceae archaeon]
MDVTAVDVSGERIPFAEAFPVSYGSNRTTDHVFVRIETDEGLVGYGEGTSLPWFTGEVLDGMVEVGREWLAPRIEGETLEAADAAVDEFAASYPGGEGATAAVEMALLDLRAKRAGVPLHELLGPRVSDTLPVVSVLPALPPNQTAERAAEAADRGFRHYKVKADGDVRTDVERINAVLEAIPGDATLRVDANTGWKNAPTARRAVDGIDDLDRIEYLEQPVHRTRTTDLREVWETTGVPVFADEAAAGPEDVETLGRDGLAAGIHLKLAKSGSLRRLVEIARTARRYDLVASTVSAFGTSLEATANLHLAATTPNDSAGIELCTELIADDPTDDPIRYGPEVTLPDGPGIGVEPDDALF